MSSLLTVLKAWSFVCDLGSSEISGKGGVTSDPKKAAGLHSGGWYLPPASLPVFFSRPSPKPSMGVHYYNPHSQETGVEQWV